jgi:CheY-specific phosphatase CheX
MQIEKPCSVRDLLSSSVVEFFDSYGVECAALPDDEGEAAQESLELGSIVGLRGKAVRGALAFVAPVSLITDLLPVPQDEEHVEIQLRDWCAEIANQVVGRLKNKLGSMTVDFDVGTPVCFTGRAIRLVFLPGAEGLSLSFRAAATPVRVHLDCSIGFECTALDAVGEDLRIAAEGDVILF